MSEVKEHDYIGLSEVSCKEDTKRIKPISYPSMESSKKVLPISFSLTSKKEENSTTKELHLKETELRLGLPGSESPERKDRENVNADDSSAGVCSLLGGRSRGVESNNGGLVGKSYGTTSGKRGFSDAKAPVRSLPDKKSEGVARASNHGAGPASKAQVVGWPPIRSFRKNSMSTNPTKNADDAEAKVGTGCLYVKVSMDGAPYLRKVDLKTYPNYLELSSALEKMFSCFTIGQCGSHGLPGREGLSESRLMDLLHGSEYVLTYEDKDGDWMLVGDVPWEMFTDSCKRLRIMKGSEAIGLAPRAMEKCKNRN